MRRTKTKLPPQHYAVLALQGFRVGLVAPVFCFGIRCFHCLNGRLYAHTKAAAWPVFWFYVNVPFGAMLALVSSGYKGPVLKFEGKT